MAENKYLEALKKIADPSIRAHYGEDIKRLRLDLFGQNAQPFRPYTPRGQGRAGGRFPFQPVAPMPSTRSSLLGSATAPVEEMLREAVILATLVAHPGLLLELGELLVA